MSKWLTVEYHKEKGILKADDNDVLKTIDDICLLTGGVKKDRGYLRAGTASLPQNDNMELWFPRANNRYWENEHPDNYETILESSKTDRAKNEKHIEECIKNGLRRVTFFKEKDIYGIEYYRFVGIYEIVSDESRSTGKCVWRRISKEYKLQ